MGGKIKKLKETKGVRGRVRGVGTERGNLINGGKFGKVDYREHRERVGDSIDV